MLEQECFSQIQKEIASQTQLDGKGNYQIAKEYVKVNLPVRVNWGGGWSDTPPYCNEHGGTVLNAAIRLRGCEPIEVEIRRIPELHIELQAQIPVLTEQQKQQKKSRIVIIHTILLHCTRQLLSPVESFHWKKKQT